MALADVAGYALTLGHVGPVAMAVTSSLSLHFLRACPPGRLHAEANLLRLGRRLVTSEVRLFVEDPARLVAQGTVVYALPATDAGAAA
jgi:acyl-coenzyme A thioesterase PaaI-like protein